VSISPSVLLSVCIHANLLVSNEIIIACTTILTHTRPSSNQSINKTKNQKIGYSKNETPKEDKRTRTLQYACRLCRYTEPAPDQPLIYRYDLKKEVGNILHTVPSAVSDDPTLARSQNANCPNCGSNEAVFFMSDVAQSDSLALIFVCCNCDHKWVN
jgi:DNA-directed RNA polymerase II subunit RPB9